MQSKTTEEGRVVLALQALAGGQVLQSPLTLALLRFGPQLNVELLAYGPEIPLALEGAHLAVFVDDLNATVERIRHWPSAHVIQEAQTVMGGPSAGLRYAYFRTPWGQRMEVLWYPEQLPHGEDPGAGLPLSRAVDDAP